MYCFEVCDTNEIPLLSDQLYEIAQEITPCETMTFEERYLLFYGGTDRRRSTRKRKRVMFPYQYTLYKF